MLWDSSKTIAIALALCMAKAFSHGIWKSPLEPAVKPRHNDVLGTQGPLAWSSSRRQPGRGAPSTVSPTKRPGSRRLSSLATRHDSALIWRLAKGPVFGVDHGAPLGTAHALSRRL